MKPASIICEVLKDDGSMARLPDLERFAATHELKICTVADLIQYRLRCDSLVHPIAEARLDSRYGGEFKIRVYKSDVDDGEHVVLIKGEIDGNEPVLVRAHAEFLPGDVLQLRERDTAALLHESMRQIAAAGRGVILYLRREGRGAEMMASRPATTGKRARTPSTDPETRERDFREYGIGAQILRDVGVRQIRLLSNFPRNLVSLPGYGLEIVECVPLAVAESSGAKKKRTTAAAKQAGAGFVVKGGAPKRG